MEKQKIVVKVSMDCDKNSRNALQIAVSISGVESASFVDSDKNQISVTGEGIDSIELTTIQTRRLGHTELLSVGLVDEKKPEFTPTESPLQVDPYTYIMKCKM